MKAALYGRAAALRALASLGADLAVAAPGGVTVVTLAAYYGHLAPVLRALEELRANTQVAAQGETPAVLAKARGHKSCAAWLKRCRGWRPNPPCATFSPQPS